MWTKTVEDAWHYKIDKRNRCRVCGQYPENGEEIKLFVNHGVRPHIKENWILNTACIADYVGSDDEIADELNKMRRPRAQNGLVEDESITRAVKDAVTSATSLVVRKETRGRVHFTRRGKKSATFLFNKKTKLLELQRRSSNIWLTAAYNIVVDQIRDRLSEIMPDSGVRYRL